MSNPNLLKNRDLFAFSVFTLDKNDGLFVDGKPVRLAPKVLQTLVFFVENQGRVITKDEFFDKVWADTFVEDNALSFNISQLRKALAAYDKQTVFIETIPKRGFRFNPEVAKIASEERVTEIVYEKYETQEIIFEESPELKSPKSFAAPRRSKTKFLPAALAVVLFSAIGGATYWQWQKNAELRSFDSLEIVKLTSWKAIESSIYFNYRASHNGKMFAYSSTKEGNEAIFVKQLNGGEDIRVTKDEWDNFSPVWSPDDQMLAFVSVRGDQLGIYSSPSLGGNSTLLKIIGDKKISLVEWSKLEPAIYYELEGNLFRLDVETKETARITNLPESEKKRFFALSSDEQQVAYCETTAEQRDVWVMQRPAGTPFQITADKDTEHTLIWHPDGKRIIYGVSRGDYSQINVGYVSGSEPLRVTRGDKDYQLLDVSNDGTEIFYVSGEDKSDIWNVELATGRESEIAAGDEAEFWSDISSDGKQIAYQINSAPYAIFNLNNSSIVVKNPAENTKQPLLKGINQKWLPDGKRLCFLRWNDENQQYNLWTFDTVSGAEKKVTENGVGLSGFAVFPYNKNQTRDFSWTNDGRRVVYLDSKKQNVWLTSVDPPEDVNLINNDDPNQTFFSPIWSNDNRKIVFVSLLRPSNPGEKLIWNVWVAENNAARVVFSTNEALRLLGWSEDAAVYCLAANGMMKSSPLDVRLLQISMAGESKIIKTFEQISALSAVLSPDGKSIAYAKRENDTDNIYLAATNGGNVKKVTNNTNSFTLFGSLAWLNNEKVFFDKQERINTISVLANFK
jgi:Tol biopolymer transport system component/DNA-binding winged helix-turn-helix (wHTH) protein